MAKSRKKKSVSVDTTAAADIFSEELRTGQLRCNPKDLDDSSLFIEDTQPDDARIHLPAGVAKRPRASKEKRKTKAQEIITANSPLPLAPVSTRCKRAKEQRPARRAISRCPATSVCADHHRVCGDAWAAQPIRTDWANNARVASRPRSTYVQNRPQIPAVEIDPGGCSYNPDQELHQDVLAQAVADEYLKEIDKELRPKPPPVAVTEEEAAFSDMTIGLVHDSSDDDEHEHDEERHERCTNKRSAEKKTKTDRLRQQRQKIMEKHHHSRRELKRARRELDSLPQLTGSLMVREELLAARKARLKADVEDRHAREPPKLGRLKFTPQPMQVLATDDVTGSLRTLKTVPLIAKDRFKSLQKRGLIHVSVKQHWLKPGTRRVKRFEKKATQEKHVWKQQVIRNMKQQRRLSEHSLLL
eukprot:jgi/Ulvmu1/2759/UM014_0217.1